MGWPAGLSSHELKLVSDGEASSHGRTVIVDSTRPRMASGDPAAMTVPKATMLMVPTGSASSCCPTNIV